MRSKKRTVLDERELQELYRIEHAGLWLMYALLCIAVVVQLLMGAPQLQMAGELIALVVVSVVMVIANIRHGIWDETSRPSLRGNAQAGVCAGVCVAAVVFVRFGDALRGLAAGVCAAAICMAVLTALMRYMQRRQKRTEEALEEE